MRTETTTRTLYHFDELTEDAQRKALQELWDVNVDGEWWDGVAEDIAEFGKVSGLGCTYGNEFDCDRGSYVHIENCSATVGELVAHQTHAQDFPNVCEDVIVPFLGTFSAKELRQLLRLERTQIVGTLSGETRTNRRGIRYDVERFDGYGTTTPRITALIDKLDQAWEQLLRDLEQCYLNMLREEYAYQTDEEQVKASILANEYEFEEDGTFA